MTDDQTTTPEPNQLPDDTSTVLPSPPASRDADDSDVLPPPSSIGRGPMDQSVPDVATGSTTVTKRDD